MQSCLNANDEVGKKWNVVGEYLILGLGRRDYGREHPCGIGEST
jgi:hypothetical protein